MKINQIHKKEIIELIQYFFFIYLKITRFKQLLQNQAKKEVSPALQKKTKII